MGFLIEESWDQVAVLVFHVLYRTCFVPYLLSLQVVTAAFRMMISKFFIVSMLCFGLFIFLSSESIGCLLLDYPYIFHSDNYFVLG